MTFWGVPPVWIFHACLEPLFGVVFLHQNVATEPCLSSRRVAAMAEKRHEEV